MSSFYGSVCLLVLLGVVSVFGSPVNVSQNLTQTHDVVAGVLKLGGVEIGRHPLFSAVIGSISCQRKEVQLMKTTLDVYGHIFSSILHHQHHENTPTLLDQLNEPTRSQVESALTKLQQDMENLKKRLSQMQHQEPHHEDLLKDLNRIKVNEPLSQKKALAEFKEVYQAASVIASRGCGATR